MASYSQHHSEIGAIPIFEGHPGANHFQLLLGNQSQDPKASREGLSNSWDLAGNDDRARARTWSFSTSDLACSNPNTTLSLPSLHLILVCNTTNFDYIRGRPGITWLFSTKSNLPINTSKPWSPLFLSLLQRFLYPPSDPPSSGFSWHPLYFQNFCFVLPLQRVQKHRQQVHLPSKSLFTSCCFLNFYEEEKAREERRLQGRETQMWNATRWLVLWASGAPTQLCPLGSQDTFVCFLLDILLHGLAFSFVYSHSQPDSWCSRRLKTTPASTHRKGTSSRALKSTFEAKRFRYQVSTRIVPPRSHRNSRLTSLLHFPSAAPASEHTGQFLGSTLFLFPSFFPPGKR